MTYARRLTWRAVLCAFLCAGFLASLAATADAAADAGADAGIAATAEAAPAANSASITPVRHVVVVGISGLRWSEVTPTTAPVLWRLAQEGSIGDLVDYAEQAAACPADGWLTLNGGARAAAPVPCGTLPEVVPDGAGARIPQMPEIIADNARFHETPDWGLLGSVAGCATAVGPGAALALATPAGAVPVYLPAPAAVNSAVLARCPLTVIDLGTLLSSERSLLTPLDTLLSPIIAELPPDTRVLLTAPGAVPGARPHLLTVLVTGPGYAGGLLNATSTRQPGIVTLTDLTTTVAGWLGRPVPPYITGARITSGARGSLSGAVRDLIGRDTAEQVWMNTHAWFFLAYALTDVILLGIPVLLWRGPDPRRRERRARWWRTAGVFVAAVPVATFLANLVPWWSLSHPAAWLYGTAAGIALVVGGAVIGWRFGRRVFPEGRLSQISPAKGGGAFGIICLFTLLVLGLDVMTGSRLQVEALFGLPLVEGARFYGIGNEALGVYCVSALVGAAWVGARVLARWPGTGWLRPRRVAVACAAVVALFAVVASGWPGFGAKVGGTIVMVPCFLVLLLALGGARARWRRVAVPVAVSGLALFAVFAVVSYFVPALGVSDMGTFAGNLLHGQGGALLERKVSSNVNTLTVSYLSPLVPVAAILTGLTLWRPSWFRLRTLSAVFSARPLLRVTVWLVWLVLVLGWFVDDSGVIVPAAALPFAVPLVIGIMTGVSPEAGEAAEYRGSAFAGPSVAGQNPR